MTSAKMQQKPITVNNMNLLVKLQILFALLFAMFDRPESLYSRKVLRASDSFYRCKTL